MRLAQGVALCSLWASGQAFTAPSFSRSPRAWRSRGACFAAIEDLETKLLSGAESATAKVTKSVKKIAPEVKKTVAPPVNQNKGFNVFGSAQRKAAKPQATFTPEIKATQKKVKADIRATEKKVTSDIKATQNKVQSDIKATEKTAAQVQKQVEKAAPRTVTSIKSPSLPSLPATDLGTLGPVGGGALAILAAGAAVVNGLTARSRAIVQEEQRKLKEALARQEFEARQYSARKKSLSPGPPDVVRLAIAGAAIAASAAPAGFIAVAALNPQQYAGTQQVAILRDKNVAGPVKDKAAELTKKAQEADKASKATAQQASTQASSAAKSATDSASKAASGAAQSASDTAKTTVAQGPSSTADSLTNAVKEKSPALNLDVQQSGQAQDKAPNKNLEVSGPATPAIPDSSVPPPSNPVRSEASTPAPPEAPSIQVPDEKKQAKVETQGKLQASEALSGAKQAEAVKKATPKEDVASDAAKSEKAFRTDAAAQQKVAQESVPAKAKGTTGRVTPAPEPGSAKTDVPGSARKLPPEGGVDQKFLDSLKGKTKQVNLGY